MNLKRFIILIAVVAVLAAHTQGWARKVDDSIESKARVYYLDSDSGMDSNSGLTAEEAWKSLSKAGSVGLKAGDTLRIKRGSRFQGSLRIEAVGAEDHRTVIEAFGQGPPPVIDASGFLAGVHILNSHYVVVKDLEIVADGGRPRDGSDARKRYGVFVQATGSSTTGHITLKNLFIHDIYPATGSSLGGRNPTSYYGTAIGVYGAENPSTNFLVEGCRIERTGYKAIDLKQIQQVQVLGNRMKDIGGPAIQPGRVDDLIVRGNVVDGSGSYVDPRMHGRGSGIWPWTCNRILIEKNRFMHARGRADSCGIHIDFNCWDVVVQYNLSYDNEGGFVEILGNNHNCAYRYNVSINDGSRVKGRDGAHQEGKVLWTSGFVGKNNTKTGPFNSYIYNNTIYVGENSRSCFSIAPTTEGLLIANNIFHIMGRTENVSGDQDKRIDKQVGRIPRAVVRNNVYLSESVLPANLPFKETNMIVGDPEFVNPGGCDPADYVPQNAELVKDKGADVSRLAGDDIGLKIGLSVDRDFRGKLIDGPPDIGAFEM
ncbi:MAG: right-handed parallel beta-helix repeat-containing protein [Planctomycetes bacterium]|nr:right-handed parallel beta-helix repeat-containing protein [Planctomycetota bacterium]